MQINKVAVKSCGNEHRGQTLLNGAVGVFKKVAVYPKNRTPLFIEDRIKPLYTTAPFSTPGKLRDGYDDMEQYGDLGQYTDYISGSTEPSSYTYTQSDSLYKMTGSGGVGFHMLDKDSNFVYAANALTFYIPSSITTEFTIYSVDADGTLHEVEKAGEGTEYVTLTKAGTLSDSLTTEAIKAVISGPINSTDIKYLRELINERSLLSIDLSAATIKSGGTAYYENYRCPANTIGNYAFYNCKNLNNIVIPESVTKINTNAFANSGLTGVYIPESVTAVNDDAFAYCNSLEQVVIGSKMKTLSKGSFYSSPVKDVYVYATTPPNVDAPYIFSSNPTIHVYKASLEAYKASKWADYAGKIVGDLDNYTAIETPVADEDNIDEANAPIYDLSGRKVKELQPGKMYISKGKKFIAK